MVMPGGGHPPIMTRDTDRRVTRLWMLPGRKTPMALPKKVLVDIDLLIDIFNYLNRLGDDDAFAICDLIQDKFDAILRREQYAAEIRQQREEALDEWLSQIDGKKAGV